MRLAPWRGGLVIADEHHGLECLDKFMLGAGGSIRLIQRPWASGERSGDGGF